MTMSKKLGILPKTPTTYVNYVKTCGNVLGSLHCVSANAFAKNIERAFNFMWEACDQASPETDDHVSFDDAIKKSIELLQANHLDEAAALARSLHRRDPKILQAIDVLAGTLLTQNKLEEAINAYEVAVKLQPDYHWFF